MSHFRKMEPFSEAALAADWKWGCGGRSPPPGARTKFGTRLWRPCLDKWAQIGLGSLPRIPPKPFCDGGISK